MSTGRKIIRTIIIAMTILWICFIFYNSLADGVESAETSGFILEKVNEILDDSGISVTEHLLRKTAHFIEFSILGILLSCSMLISLKNNIFIPLFIGLLVPVTDETIQLFIDGRSGQVSDIMLDFSGVLFGIGILYVFDCLIISRIKGLRKKRG